MQRNTPATIGADQSIERMSDLLVKGQLPKRPQGVGAGFSLREPRRLKPAPTAWAIKPPQARRLPCGLRRILPAAKPLSRLRANQPRQSPGVPRAGTGRPTRRAPV